MAGLKLKLSTAVCIALAACQISAPVAAEPAVIVHPNAASRSELLRVVRGALHAPVLIAENALTTSSILSIEGARPRDSAGLLIDGRDLRVPERFDLIKQGAECILLQARTTNRWILTQTQCAAERTETMLNGFRPSVAAGH